MKKLSQKSGGHQSDEAVLMKAFKYFDLNNNGTVEPEEFAKAVEKIGIMIPTKQVSHFSKNPVLIPSANKILKLVINRTYHSQAISMKFYWLFLWMRHLKRSCFTRLRVHKLRFVCCVFNLYCIIGP